MLRRISIVVAIMAMLFSVQALPLLYTFEGTINNVDGEAADINMVYQLLMDFDAPALINGSLVNDFTYGGTSYDFASATFYETSDVLYPSLVYTTENAVHKATEFHGSYDYENSVLFQNKNTSNYLLNSFSLNNTLQSAFQIGDAFSVNEFVNENNFNQHSASGFVTLTAISSLNPQSVPEPNEIILIILGGIGVWMMSQRKRLQLIKCTSL